MEGPIHVPVDTAAAPEVERMLYSLECLPAVLGKPINLGASLAPIFLCE